MEAGQLTEAASPAWRERLEERFRQSPAFGAGVVLAIIFLALVVSQGLHDVLQTSLNGLSLGAIYALGAVGLTLVYGILKLTNFAHGDYLTFGAYMAYLVNVTWGAPAGRGGLLGDAGHGPARPLLRAHAVGADAQAQEPASCS